MKTYRLRDGTKVRDPRLGRIVQFDEASRAFKVVTVVAKKPRSMSWRCKVHLNQGSEGSCVGHGCGHELLARPAEADAMVVTHKYAREQIYWAAQKKDDWPGGSYPGAKPFYEGTSVLAGVKVVCDLGWCDSYRWSFGLQDLILGVGHAGPAIMGLAWYEGMMRVDIKGYIHPQGPLGGGHCILCKAVDIKREKFTLHNSWGIEWGNNGDCFITFKDMERLLKEDGEACFLMGRKSHVEPC